MTSFTANWNAFVGASYYLLDVSTSSSFSSFVGSYQNFVVLSTSQLVSGLTASTTYYYRLRAATGVDADAAAFFGRVYTAGGALSYTEVSATETLVASLKANSLWTPMKAIYPMVGASAAACAQNLKSSSFTGTFTSGWTFASTGVTPNGSSAYMNTAFNASTDFAATTRSMSYYNRTNTASGYDMGCSELANDIMVASRYTGTTNAYTCFGSTTGGYTFVSTATAIGLTMGSNISNTEKLFKNGTQIATMSKTIGNANLTITLAASNRLTGTLEFTNHECAFASIGDGLTDTQASDFYTAVQAFQTTLARNV
jgi:hypothetical protein